MPNSEIIAETFTTSLVQTNQLTEFDTKLIDMWVHGKSIHTADYYRRYVTQFLEFVQKPLVQVNLSDLQDFETAIAQKGLADSSQRSVMAAIKSVLTYGHKIGLLPVNVGVALLSKKVKDTLSERILTEADVMKMVLLEADQRNRLILRVLYACGLRVSELCQLTWSNLQGREGGEGQATVFGKGGKTRVVIIPAVVWKELTEFRGKRKAKAESSAPVFRSRKQGGHLTRAMVTNIVREAAKRAGIPADVSPHWLRHAHASHALDRNAPIHLVQTTLGHSSVATTSRYLHAKPSDSSSRYLPL
jgi:integrase/recombinase XerD